ncbi:hypothetical protein F5X68DRAFT_187423 [Plectosphaerella plurivora]|uniref:Uncharacterized protein n=1 Tax=Plectosphaerella plurivora TaxID=936078 RepID=A0A9P8VIU9_9PEZI|nr:hypothetical protein F5X68DRAFT_187423 [Plectosphaerella plurivora]
MSGFPITILNVLTQPGPTITSLNNHASGYCPGLSCRLITEITEWDDLTVTNIHDAYSDILVQEHIDQPTLAASIRVNKIKAVPDVKQMESTFLHRLVGPSLNQGCGIIGSRLVSSTATPPVADIEIRLDKRLGPARPNTTLFWGTQLLLFGVSKRDADWTFSSWASDRGHPTAQLAGYATSANTRYTYIITDSSILGVRRKVVPLDGSGSDTLTPGLALWAVTMMALNERHRPIAGLHQIARLNEWIPLFNSENQAVYRNVISARVKEGLPEGAVGLLPPRPMGLSHMA